MIYLIEDQNRRIKIGYTAKPQGSKNRLYSMRTGNPENLKIVCEFDGGTSEEAAFHRLLSKNRISREWFYGEPRDRKFHHTITLAQMDGSKVLSMDLSEIEYFTFIPELAANKMRVPDFRALKKRNYHDR